MALLSVSKMPKVGTLYLNPDFGGKRKVKVEVKTLISDPIPTSSMVNLKLKQSKGVNLGSVANSYSKRYHSPKNSERSKFDIGAGQLLGSIPDKSNGIIIGDENAKADDMRVETSNPKNIGHI